MNNDDATVAFPERLRRMDMNLLVAFFALCRERSVTLAARRMSVTQPALSNALRRLRVALGDPLFARKGRELILTPFAEGIAPDVAKTLADLDAQLFGARTFDPAKAEATVRIALSPYWQFVLLPKLLRTLDKRAPRIVIEVHDPTETTLQAGMRTSEWDAALYLSGIDAVGLRSQPLFWDRYCVVTRRPARQKGSLRQLRPMSLLALARHRFIAITPVGPWAIRLRSALDGMGKTMRVVLSTAHPHVAMEVMESIDAITIYPRSLAIALAARWRVAVRATAVDLGTVSLSLYWHERTAVDPIHGWIRALIARLVREASPLPKGPVSK